MPPIDYSLNPSAIQGAFEAPLRGASLATGLLQQRNQLKAQELALRNEQQALELQREQARANAERQQYFQQSLVELSNKEDLGASDIARATLRHPEIAKELKSAWEILGPEQQQAKIGQASQIYSAIASNPEVAKNLLDEQAKALRNSNREQEAQAVDSISKVLEIDPRAAQTMVGLSLASVLGADKFEKNFSALGHERRAEALAPTELAKGKAEAELKGAEASIATRRQAAEVKDIESRVEERGLRLELDRDKLKTETELKLDALEADRANRVISEPTRKEINNAASKAVEATQSARNLVDLAQRFDKARVISGLGARSGELLKQAYGSEDAITLLRKEYLRVRSAEALKSLPPGPATDKDVAVAFEGFPKDTSDARTMASFLRGVAKLNTAAAVISESKAEWLNAVGYLGKPGADITVSGIQVPAGTTYADFTKRTLPLELERRFKEIAPDVKSGSGAGAQPIDPRKQAVRSIFAKYGGQPSGSP